MFPAPYSLHMMAPNPQCKQCFQLQSSKSYLQYNYIFPHLRRELVEAQLPVMRLLVIATFYYTTAWTFLYQYYITNHYFVQYQGRLWWQSIAMVLELKPYLKLSNHCSGAASILQGLNAHLCLGGRKQAKYLPILFSLFRLDQSWLPLHSSGAAI